MISRVRIDDTLWESSDPKLRGREIQKFKKYVNWCRDANVYVVPNVLCQDIEKFPGAVDMLNEFEQVDLHGWDHGDYANRSYAEICEHLEKSMEWFQKNTKHVPIRWVTPHGANSRPIQDAAAKFNLVVETTMYPVVDQKAMDGMLKESRNPSILDGVVIMSHWWERGLALYRICQIVKHGTIPAAITATKTNLDDQSWDICWNGGWLDPV